MGLLQELFKEQMERKKIKQIKKKGKKLCLVSLSYTDGFAPLE